MEDCYPAADLRQNVITLQALAACLFAKFQADGFSSFKVGTIVVVPEATAEVGAAEGRVLEWRKLIRSPAYSGQRRRVKLVIIGQMLPT